MITKARICASASKPRIFSLRLSINALSKITNWIQKKKNIISLWVIQNNENSVSQKIIVLPLFIFRQGSCKIYIAEGRSHGLFDSILASNGSYSLIWFFCDASHPFFSIWSKTTPVAKMSTSNMKLQWRYYYNNQI